MDARGPNLMRRLPALLLTLCICAACNMRQIEDTLPTPDENNIIYVTATPAPATATATPPPAPTATATPAIAPARLLQMGERQMLNGYFEAAADLFAQLLEAGSALPADQRANAAFGLGQASLRSGDYQRAFAAFNLLIAEFPAQTQVAQAYFLRGDARLGLQHWEAAISDFQQYLALRPGLIDSYAYERIGDAQLALGQTEAAARHFQRAINAKRSLVPLLALREKLARISLSQGRHGEAVAQYDAILAVARNQPYRASIALAGAEAALDGGNLEAGLERLRSIVDSYAGTATAWAALQALSEHGVAFDNFQRGRAAYSAGDWQGAVDAFNAYLSANETGTLPAELYLSLGRAYRQLHNSTAATNAFQRIIDDYATDPLFGDALLERGRTRFLAGDSDAAIALYLAIADSYPQLEATAAVALWRAGYLYGTIDETALSRQVFLRLAQQYPRHSYTVNGLFIAASAALRDEAWTAAADIYTRITELAEGEDLAGAYLWLGRIARDHGDTLTANEAFEQAVQAAPDSYFAARAADFRRGIAPFQAPAAWQFDFDEAEDLAAAESWLRERFNIEAPGELWRLGDALDTDPRMIRGRELAAVNAHVEAASEFQALLDEARDQGNALDSYRLALALRDLGYFRESIIAAADVIIAGGQGTANAPALLARLRFPAYYIDVIQPEAAAYGIDPVLMLALIRQESLFHANATAAAGEKGLMQVIPATAQYIADQLNWPAYQHSQLFRPYAGIAFGAWYLDEQLDRFSQRTVSALAAYNAGPGRAYDWDALAGGDPDLFMTTITIDSTRLYIQFIYRNYNIYRSLYGIDAP